MVENAVRRVASVCGGPLRPGRSVIHDSGGFAARYQTSCSVPGSCVIFVDRRRVFYVTDEHGMWYAVSRMRRDGDTRPGVGRVPGLRDDRREARAAVPWSVIGRVGSPGRPGDHSNCVRTSASYFGSVCATCPSDRIQQACSSLLRARQPPRMAVRWAVGSRDRIPGRSCRWTNPLYTSNVIGVA